MTGQGGKVRTSRPRTLRREGNEQMANKQIRLPKEGVVASEDQKGLGPDTDTDVEGHGIFSPAPPADFSPRTPSSGGEAIPGDEPAEGERRP
jgi:hypothetical protein